MFGTTIAAGKQYIKQGRIQDFALGGGRYLKSIFTSRGVRKPPREPW